MKKFLVAALAAVFISVSSTAIAAAGGEANGEDTYVNQTKQQKTRLFSKKDKNSENAVKNLKNNEKRFSDKEKEGKQQNGRGGQYGRPPMNDQNGRGGQQKEPAFNNGNEQKAQPSAKDKDGNLSPVSGSRNPQGNQSAKTESEE